LFSQAVDFILRRKKFFIFIVGTFLVIVGISTLCRGGIGPPPRRTDLTVFLSAAEAIKSGANIYIITNDRGWHYVYMPLLAVLLTPFTRLPLLLNTFLWYMLSVVALCGTVLLSARLAQDRLKGMRAAVMAMIFCIPPLVESLTRGQTGVMFIFLAIAILYLYTRGRVVWAGVLLAFSVVLKVSPLALLVVFFLVKREWKTLAAALLGIFFFAWALPSIVIGADRNWLLLKEWSYSMTHAISGAGNESRIWTELVNPLAHDNQSLYAVFTRWACPTETVLATHNDFWIRWGVRIFGVLALSIIAFISRRGKSQSSPKRVMIEYSLFLILMLLVSPVSETHHYTILFALFLPVFLYLDELPRNSVSYQCLMWASLIAGFTQILNYVFPFDMWGFPAIGALIFWCVSLVFLARLKKENCKLQTIGNR
jgi:hypothetical protein